MHVLFTTFSSRRLDRPKAFLDTTLSVDELHIFCFVFANLVSFIQFLSKKFPLQFRGIVQTQLARRRLGNGRKSFFSSPGEGVCGSLSTTQTKIYDFLCPICGLTKNPTWSLNHYLFHICLIISSLVQSDFKVFLKGFCLLCYRWWWKSSFLYNTCLIQD